MVILDKLKSLWRRINPPGGSVFLCDSCKYDHPNSCHRPERPNARECPDYRRRGS